MNFNIPKILSHLKVDERGYPIPFFVPIQDGKPNFKYMDRKKQDFAIDNRVCHVCGLKLNKDYFYFISGPIGYKNQVSSDAAMHRGCAEFTLEVCPHLLYQKAERKSEQNPLFEQPIILEKPDYLLLIKAD